MIAKWDSSAPFLASVDSDLEFQLVSRLAISFSSMSNPQMFRFVLEFLSGKM